MIKVLFICHGNICRSTAAQYIFQNLVNQKGKQKDYRIDSAATSSEETGHPVYPPMRQALEKAGIPVGSHHARTIRTSDYDAFDLLIGMDEENRWNLKQLFPEDPGGKIHLLMEYTDHPDEMIEDPWYTRRFTACVQQLEEGCYGLLKFLEEKKQK